ncbi:MAG: hypothetical protein HOQ22_14155 [Nocardioidaceae bacterium]|nr:hypothetical protein [Nocardioidaceae bacterium]NUS52168.1 hypothetical protein [Nocardioidaceae bacterium]
MAEYRSATGGASFTDVCCTGHVPVTYVYGRKARIDISVDGVTFTRSESDAARRATPRRVRVEWDDVTGAEVRTTRKGRAVVRVGVTGAEQTDDHRHDPYAVKVARHQSEAAYRLVEQVNEEVAARRRWRRHAPQ